MKSKKQPIRSGQMLVLSSLIIFGGMALAAILLRGVLMPQRPDDELLVKLVRAAELASGQLVPLDGSEPVPVVAEMSDDSLAQVAAGLPEQVQPVQLSLYDLTGQVISTTFPQDAAAIQALALTTEAEELLDQSGRKGMTKSVVIAGQEHTMLFKPLLGPDRSPIAFISAATPSDD